MLGYCSFYHVVVVFFLFDFLSLVSQFFLLVFFEAEFFLKILSQRITRSRRKPTNMEMGVTTPANMTDTDLPPLAERAVEGVVLVLICILATGGNLVLWLVVIRTPDLHSSSNMLLLCLSAADLLVAVFNMPLTAYTIFVGR